MATSPSPSLPVELNPETPAYTFAEVQAAHDLLTRAYRHLQQSHGGMDGFDARWLLLEVRGACAEAMYNAAQVVDDGGAA